MTNPSFQQAAARSESLKRLVNHHWRDVLGAAGIDAVYLNGRHCACPLCGDGVDRFRFADTNGSGSWVCSTCNPDFSDGWGLLMLWLRCDFLGALAFVESYFGKQPLPLAPAREFLPVLAKTAPNLSQVRRRIQQLWKSCLPVTPQDVVTKYLNHRGIHLEHVPATIRTHPALEYWHVDQDNKPVSLGRYPAMVSAIQGPDGKAVALHQIFLTPDGKKADVPSPKKWTKPCADTSGAAVRLFEPAATMGVAEGIETALACHSINKLPIWAGVSAAGLKKIVLPEVVGSVVIFADHDQSGAGQKAADQLAERLLSEGREVRVLLPSDPGRDWLDVAAELNQTSEVL